MTTRWGPGCEASDATGATAVRRDDERLLADSGRLQLLEARFSHVRSFAPHVLTALCFAASVSPSEVLDAEHLLQAMNAEGRRHVPDGAPAGFVPSRWQPSLTRPRPAARTPPSSTTGNSPSSSPSKGRCAPGRSGSRDLDATPTRRPT
jgi:hypothetical protein